MNKVKFVLSTMCLSAFLFSCNSSGNATTSSSSSNVTSAIESSLITSEVTSEITSEIISSEESSVIESSSDEYNIRVGSTYQTNYWDAKLEAMIRFSIGSQIQYIPKFTCSYYDVLVAREQDPYNEEYFVTYTDILCKGVNSSSATKLYKEALEAKEFYIAYSGNYAYKMIDYCDDLIVDYALNEDEEGTYSFSIRTYIYESRTSIWEEEAISLYADTTLPKFEAPSYNYYYSTSPDYFDIYANFVDANALTNYASKLTKAGYVATSSYQDTYIYEDSLGYLSITLALTQGDYNSTSLLIRLSSNWPTIGLLSFIGISIPKLDPSIGGVYDSYSYLEFDDGSYALCIYYNDLIAQGISIYANQLVSIGFEFVNELSSAGDYITASLDATRDDGYIIPIDLYYKISTATLCIAVYEAYLETK